MLKQLRPETREAAKAAARRSGQSVQEWLDNAVAQSAAEDEELFDDGSVQDRLDELTRKIDRLTSTGPAAYAPVRSRKQPNDGDDLTHMVERLDRRLDQFVKFAHAMPSVVTRPQPGFVNPAVAEIAARQRALRGEAPLPAPPMMPPAMPAQRMQPAPVDAQYAHAAGYAAPQPAQFVQQQAYAPHPQPAAFAPPPAPMPVQAPVAPPMPPQAPLPSQDLSGLESQLRQITNQIETLRKPGVEDAINALRAELSQIAQSLTEAMPRHVIDAIDAQIRDLSQRLSEGREAGVAGEVLASIEQHLGDIHTALRSLTPAEHLTGFNDTVSTLAQRIDAIVAQKDPASFAALEEAVNNLRGVATHIASNEAVGELAAQVQALTGKVEQIAYTSSGDAALSHLEQRISALSDAIAERNQNGNGVPHHLEHLVGSLSEKIEQIQSARGEGHATRELEDRIINLAEKLDASDSRLANLEAVERGLTDLLRQTDRFTAPAANAGPSPEYVDDLRRDVARTQNSLESVHSTLAILVDRLAAIEHGMRDRPAAHAAPAHLPPAPMLHQPVEAVVAQVVAAASQIQSEGHMAPAPRQPAPQPPAPMPSAPMPMAQPAAQSAPKSAPKPALRRSQPIDPDLPPDQPIEPGMARPTAARAANATVAIAQPSPAARIAASEAALASGRPPVIPDPAGQSNFIAAARRAAKAAEQEPGPPIPVPPRAPEPPMNARFRAPSPGIVLGKLKSLLIAGSVVAIVVGGYYVVGNMLDNNGAPATAPTVQKPEIIRPDVIKPLGAAPETAPAIRPAPPALDAGSGFKLLAPDSSMNAPGGAQGPAPLPAQPAPADQGDVTNSIGPKRTIAIDKLPSSFGTALREAAAAGDAAAAYEIATRYADGQGVAGNLEEAARWFERAAQQGLAPAQFRLGSLYEKGQGVRRDLKAARKLYISAADQGNAKAMHDLAVLYAEGIEGRPDYKTASQWFIKAAGYGVPDSQYNLAILYARGLGVEKSMQEAYKWFSLAAAQGDKESAKKRDEVGNRLDPATRTVAENAVKTWTPQLQPPKAIRVPAPPAGWDRAAEIEAGRSAAVRGPVRIGAR